MGIVVIAIGGFMIILWYITNLKYGSRKIFRKVQGLDDVKIFGRSENI